MRKWLGMLAAIALGAAVVHFARGRGKSQRQEPAVPAAAVLRFEAVDSAGRPLPCRFELRDAEGKSVTPPGLPVYDGAFVTPGKGELTLPPGPIHYEVERGPEYRPAAGSLEVRAGAPNALHVVLTRLIDLPSRGWYAGDLHVHRKPEDAPLLVRAEDLHVLPVITWWNDPEASRRTLPVEPDLIDGRFVDRAAGEDEREAGALMYFRARKPLPLPASVLENGHIVHRAGDERDEYPPSSEFARMARADPRVHIDIEKPFWWDVPTWIALGLGDSIGIAHNHMDRRRVHDSEAWGRRCDRKAYPEGLLANGYCTQDLYYRLLDAGIRLAPSAGSASGVLENPVGYDRVYVHAGTPFAYDAWWQGLKQGHSFVTNGPLLLVEANGEGPGSVLRGAAGEGVSVKLEVELAANDPIAAVELVRDGKVVATAAYADGEHRARFEPFVFGASGWFLVRALTTRTDTFRFASTAPFYVEVGATPRRISRSAASFWLAWVRERTRNIRQGGAGPAYLDAMLQPELAAERFWEAQVAAANAD